MPDQNIRPSTKKQNKLQKTEIQCIIKKQSWRTNYTYSEQITILKRKLHRSRTKNWRKSKLRGTEIKDSSTRGNWSKNKNKIIKYFELENNAIACVIWSYEERSEALKSGSETLMSDEGFLSEKDDGPMGDWDERW